MEGAPQHRDNIQELLNKAHDEALVDNEKIDGERKAATLEKIEALNLKYKIISERGEEFSVEDVIGIIRRGGYKREGCIKISLNGGESFCVNCAADKMDDENSVFWKFLPKKDKEFLYEIKEVNA